VFTATTEKAVQIAAEANKDRDKEHTIKPPVKTAASILYWSEKYIAWREEYEPTLCELASWKNRRNQLKRFAEHFRATPVNRLTLKLITAWWHTLTAHAQHSRRAEFNKFFNYLAGQGLTPLLSSNPFTKLDDRPRTINKKKPDVKRMRLPIEDFWIIYDKAGEMGYECLQIAMGISLVTTLRREDVVQLQFDSHVTAQSLKKTVNKSEAQRGSIAAAHLEFSFTDHPLLAQLINRGRELSLKNFRCPYLVSFTPKQRRTGKTKSHVAQVTGDRLGKMFEEVREATKLYKDIGSENTPPTFHEVRALSSFMLKNAGHDVKAVQVVMAHTDPRVTMGYQARHETPEFTKVGISIAGDQLGRGF
jgi:integrase